MQSVRTTNDPRITALANRMDALVAQMKRERTDGRIDPETSRAFCACDAAYWRVLESDPAFPVDLDGIESEQVTAAIAGNVDLGAVRTSMPLPC